MEFSSIDFSEGLLDSIDAMNFREMTPVQEQAIPVIMNGRDLIACAQTGTGKTAAFMLPILDKLSQEKSYGKVRALVIVPTRELAVQIDQQIQGFSYYINVSSIPVYGGNNSEGWDAQKKALVTGADVVVATPGRMLSHLNLKYVDLSNVEFLILDEADRMLDIGFYDDIMRIAAHLKNHRQTLLFSATMPPKIRTLAKQILVNPAEISIAIAKPAEKIEQRIYMAYDGQKTEMLIRAINAGSYSTVIVFASRKTKVKEIARTLKQRKVSVAEIHSDLEQSEREDILRNFRNRKLNVLVATDILSRGIDIEKIDMVVNFDVPPDPEDYVHRIGRTARAEETGVALTFVNEDDIIKFSRIERLIEKDFEKLSVDADLGESPAYKLPERRKKGYMNKKKKPNSQKKHFTGNNSSTSNSNISENNIKRKKFFPNKKQNFNKNEGS